MKVDQGPFSVSEGHVAICSCENSELGRVLKTEDTVFQEE